MPLELPVRDGLIVLRCLLVPIRGFLVASREIRVDVGRGLVGIGCRLVGVGRALIVVGKPLVPIDRGKTPHFAFTVPVSRRGTRVARTLIATALPSRTRRHAPRAGGTT
jgi:predicted cation transporter